VNKAFFEKILNSIAGSSHDFGLEHRIFNFVIAISISSGVPGLFFMLFQGIWQLALLLTVTNALFFYSYWLSRTQNQLQKAVLVYSILQAGMLNLFWIIGYGAQGTTGFLLFVFLIIIVFTAEKPTKYLVGTLINLIIISIFDDYIQSLVQWELPFSIVTQKVTLIMSVVYMGVLVLFYKQLIRRRLDQTYYDVMAQLDSESAIVNKTADSLATTSQQLLAFALQQKTATEELSVTTEELGATAEENQKLATSAMSTIKAVDQNIDASKGNIDTLVGSIDKIKSSSEEIQTINNVMSDIAYQTNILSLNAMIEASRSGDSNGGFKVVALEVKRLAERSAKAGESINKLLTNNFKTVNDSVSLADDVNKRFKEISDSMIPLVAVIQNVADASAEQHEAIRQITKGIEDIDHAVEENNNLAGLSSKTANELRKNAESLMAVVELLQTVVEEA
jgi:archaellum component FlaC